MSSLEYWILLADFHKFSCPRKWLGWTQFCSTGPIWTLAPTVCCRECKKSWINLNYSFITSVNTISGDIYVNGMNHEYKFRLRLDIVKAIPDIYNSLYTEYAAFERPVRPNFFLIIKMFILSPKLLTYMFVHKQNKQTDKQIVIIIIIIIIQ